MVYEQGHSCYNTHVEVKNNWMELVLSFYLSMGSRDQTQVSGSHSEHFTHWAHLPSPCYFSKGRLYSESQFEGIVCHRGEGLTVIAPPAVQTKHKTYQLPGKKKRGMEVDAQMAFFFPLSLHLGPEPMG